MVSKPDYTCAQCGVQLHHPNQTMCRTCLPKRTCPVCLDLYAPRRRDQIFCRKDVCRSEIKKIVKARKLDFLVVVLKQEGKCWRCQKVEAPAVSSKGSPLRVALDLEAVCEDPSDPATIIHAGCGPCRNLHYLNLAITLGQQSPTARP